MRVLPPLTAPYRLLPPVVLGLSFVLLVSSCQRRGVDLGELKGWVLSAPLPKVDFTLTDTDGEPFAFREETDGFVTLVFFGYTHCPDICPIHMANIGAAMRELPANVTDSIKVVFVTTDPDRDTPERLREWLDHFSSDFVGLAGPLDEVNEIQQAIGFRAAFREEWPDGGYGIAHASRVIAYTTDNEAHVLYGTDAKRQDWADDLPKLVLDGPPVR